MVAIKNPTIGSAVEALHEHPAFIPLQGVELALLRARPALDAGWQLTPEAALSMAGPQLLPSNHVTLRSRDACGELEDDLDELAFFFGES